MPMDRRDWLHGSLVALLWVHARLAQAATMISVRIWPAADYSRVTLESNAPLKTRPTIVASPPRL
ncbi:MAG: N-acetylmuramoyl-L-alanine amidase, partial [Limnohabitans sp.]